MKRKNKEENSCPPDSISGGCRMEAILTIDERGQLVIPKDVRDLALIRAGDRLALVSCRREGEVCCLMLIQNDRLTGMVKTVLSPVMKEIIGENEETYDVRK